MTDDVYIGDTGKLGKGVFAGRDFAVDDLVLVVKGKVVEVGDASELSQFDQDHCFPVGWNKYVLPQPPWMYLNHSCNPNAGIRNNREIVAMRPIAKGEEITIDYAMNNNDEWTIECHCGEPNCRRIIGGFDLLDVETKKRYRGYVSTFIAEKFYKGEKSSDLKEETQQE